MSKKKRVSLSVRLQPYENTLVAEVADWLNSIEKDEKNRLIADAIVMAYLPYARANQKVSASEVERCCWETQNMLDKHGFNLRQALQVSQPQWHSPEYSQEIKKHNPSYNSSANFIDIPQVALKENDSPELVPKSLIEGSDKLDDDGFFADDEFDA